MADDSDCPSDNEAMSSQLSGNNVGPGQANLMCEPDEPRISAISSRECDWETIADPLRTTGRLDCHTEVFGGDLMKIPVNLINTMDGASKSWRTMDPKSDALLSDETEGGSWAFCEKCVAQIPKHLQEILYFFHRLKSEILDYRGYAVPGRNIVFLKTPSNKDAVAGLLWCRTPDRRRAETSNDMEDVDMNSIMSERRRGRDGEVKTRIDPIKIRLGMTGAFYTVDGKEEIMTFAVLVITWARNFDMLGYITQKFLAVQRSPSQRDDVEKLQMIWKRMQRFVAFDNLGLDESKMGLPEECAHQPCGPMGVDSLFNLFQIPFQIRGIIRTSILERKWGVDRAARLQDVKVTHIRILGMPELLFQSGDDKFNDYVSYMQIYLDNLANERAGFEVILCKVNAPKDKENKEAGEALAMELDNPGAWPLARNENRTYTRFGMPMLPVWLNFMPEFPATGLQKEKWLALIGGASGLPEVVKLSTRTFLVRSTDISNWGLYLNDGRPANSSLVLQEYYGEKSNPLSGLMLAGQDRSFWVAFQKDLTFQRDKDIRSRVDIFNQFLRISVCQHIDRLRGNTFRSPRLEQSIMVLERINFPSISKSIGAFVHDVEQRLPFDMVCNRYIAGNASFYTAFENLNQAYLLNSSNLEFLLELMVSDVMWNLGEDNATVPSFFQAIQIVAGNGHYKTTLKSGAVIWVTIKPNTTGMDYTYNVYIDLSQKPLDMVGVTNKSDNLQMPINVANWTPVAIQLCCCASVCENTLDTLPETTMQYRSSVMTEMRSNTELKTLIQYAIPRQPGSQAQVSLNTCDPSNTNQRKSMTRITVSRFHLCAFCTNILEVSQEEMKTVGVVTHRMNPGSGPPTNKRAKNGSFNQAECSSFSGRKNRTHNLESVINVLMYTHMFALSLPALMNRSSIIPYEINPSVLGVLDWLAFWIKEHMQRSFETVVFDSYKRMCDGYEARQVTKSLWATCIMVIPQCSTMEEAFQRVVQIMHCNALPLSEAVPAFYNLVTRGANMACLLMSAVMAQHFNVPVIKINQLKRFLFQSQVI